MPFVAVVQLLHQCLTQYPLTFPVDEHDLFPLVAEVFVHHLAESVYLIIDYIGVAHASCAVYKLVDMQVNHKRLIFRHFFLHRFPHQFSGGQRQRIGIARSLALKPRFVVCDEAVSALDVSIQSQILNLLSDLKEQEHLTYLFITHDLSVVKYISDRIGVMYLGNLVELASTEELFDRTLHPYTNALLSAIPTTDVNDKKRDRILLEGDIPSPVNPPTGCKFHTRCYRCQEKCKKEVPVMTDMGNNHMVACHYPLEK